MSDPKLQLQLLTPKNCQVIFIDHQPQMAFGMQSMDRQVLKNNTVALAKAAKVFGVPVTITTVETLSSRSGSTPCIAAAGRLGSATCSPVKDDQVADQRRRLEVETGQTSLRTSARWPAMAAAAAMAGLTRWVRPPLP
jgi:nicotinamidase-related amidase